MQRLVAVITGLHLLAHSIFGCCAHHAAPAKNTPCCHSDQTFQCTHPHASHRHPSEAVESTDSLQAGFHQQSAPHHDCPHNSCQWLKSERIDCSGLVNFHLTSVVAPLAIAASGLLSDHTALSVHFLPAPLTQAPSLRLHLALGVLLI